MFRHRLKNNYLFAFNCIWLLIFFKDVDFYLLYFSYFVFFGIGIGMGFHRIVCHQQNYSTLFSQACVFIGSMTHVGSIKGSMIWHTQHHLHADSNLDIYKNFSQALVPRLSQINIPKKMLSEKFKAYSNSEFYKKIDSYFYLLFSIFYFLVSAFFGFKNMTIYFLAPAALALISHSYGSVFIHKFGYKNFNTKDNSKNSILLLPIFFGENWHNNHHQYPGQENLQINFWEIDLLFWLCRVFRK